MIRLTAVLLVVLAATLASANTPETLRAAIRDLAATYPDRYTNAAPLLARLDAEGYSEALARTAVAQHPLLADGPLLFVARRQYAPDHHNTETIFQRGEVNTASYRPGGRLALLDLGSGRATTLVDAGPEGLARDPDVEWQGERIVFAWRRARAGGSHLYEIRADGTGLRRLTSAEGVNDLDPAYLPDGDIVFSSTREPKYCMCNRHIMGNLFRMEPDGANIRQIGRSTLFEGHPQVMPDGRLLYDRWEYVDRNFGDGQALWTANPDGTAHAIYWGSNVSSPGGVIDARFVPGTDLCLAIFAACHDRPWGALALLDRREGVDRRAAVRRTWPPEAADLFATAGSGRWDSTIGLARKYEDPYPLDARFFLVSRQVRSDDERTGLYVVDLHGNEVLLHEEKDLGCYDPMPLAPRPRPPVIADRIDLRSPEGTFYVQNVYEGTHMEGVSPGSVKALRVVESPEKRFWTEPAWAGQGSMAPAMNWHDFNNKRILGTVPVEEDGSAYFAVPADTFVYFQLLDADGMMVQSMRSGTIVRPGERQSCVGCHEDRLAAPAASLAARTRALQRAPSRLEGWHGPPRLFSYRKEVQPVFDRRCVACHDYRHAKEAKVVLAGDRGLAFNASYADLWTKGYLRVVGAGPAEIQPANSWGARASRLVQVLREGHQDVKLDPEEIDRIATWIDLNAPYYPSYATAHPAGRYGRSPLTDAQLARLAELGIDVRPQGQVAQVSFDRPEASPCLLLIADTNSAAYAEALAILRAGAAELARNPESDAPGFAPCAVDAAREAKYLARQAAEKRNRDAILRGMKVYDE